MENEANIVYIGNKYWSDVKCNLEDPYLRIYHFHDPIEAEHAIYKHNADVVICEMQTSKIDGITFYDIEQSKMTHNNVLFFLINETFSPALLKKALDSGIADCITPDIDVDRFADKFLYFRKLKRADSNIESPQTYSISDTKRFFDKTIALSLICIFSPFILTLSAIKLIESKNNFFEKKPRIGNGFSLFTLYHFHLSYIKREKIGVKNNIKYGALEHIENITIPNKFYKKHKKVELRMTQFSTFLFRTRLYKIPELINVLKGDISIVGDQPIDYTDAEKLTTSQWKEYLTRPKGITGNFSKIIAKHKTQPKGTINKLSEQKYSTWFDIKLIARSIVTYHLNKKTPHKPVF